MDYSWDEAVSNLCHGANVYRFVTIDTGDVGNVSNNASKCTAVKTSATSTLSFGRVTSHIERSEMLVETFELNTLGDQSGRGLSLI